MKPEEMDRLVRGHVESIHFAPTKATAAPKPPVEEDPEWDDEERAPDVAPA